MTASAAAAPDISVVMGTYNGAPYLRDQLNTILNQDQKPLEIILSDDGSSDETVQIAQRVAAEADVPITVIRNATTLGFGDNFLAACEHASGRFIAFSDQDDLWYASKLRASRQALVESGALLCVHAVDEIDAEGRFLRRNDQRIQGAQVVERLEGDPWDVYYGFTMLFERSLLGHFGRQERGKDIFTLGKPLSHDRWVYFLASCLGRVVTVPVSLAGYRQHGSQLYGGAAPRSLARRVSDKLTSGGERLQHLAGVADDRVTLLRSGADRMADPRLGEAAERWAGLATALHTSARVRSQPGLLAGLRLLAGNARRGAYRPVRAGGLGYRYLLEDLAVLGLLPAMSAARQRQRAAQDPEMG